MLFPMSAPMYSSTLTCWQGKSSLNQNDSGEWWNDCFFSFVITTLCLLEFISNQGSISQKSDDPAKQEDMDAQ